MSSGKVAYVLSRFQSGGVEVLADNELLIRLFTVIHSIASVTFAVLCSSQSSLVLRIGAFVSFRRLFLSPSAKLILVSRPARRHRPKARFAALCAN